MRVDAAKFTHQGLSGNFGEGTSHLHASGACANHAQGQPVLAFFRIGFFFRRLKGKQQAAANFKRVLQRFQAWRMGGPIVVSKVTVGGTRGDDQVVKHQGAAIGQMHLLACCIDVGDFREQGGQVGLVSEQAAGGCGNRRCCQACGGHLVEQGLEQVVVGFVHQGDVDRCFGQGFGRFQSAETASNDQDAGALRSLHWQVFLAQASLCWCRAICCWTCPGAVPPTVLRAFKEPFRLKQSYTSFSIEA